MIPPTNKIISSSAPPQALFPGEEISFLHYFFEENPKYNWDWGVCQPDVGAGTQSSSDSSVKTLALLRRPDHLSMLCLMMAPCYRDEGSARVAHWPVAGAIMRYKYCQYLPFLNIHWVPATHKAQGPNLLGLEGDIRPGLQSPGAGGRRR